MALKKMITDGEILEIHKSLWAEAKEEYGNAFSVPHTVAFSISSRVRALYCLQIWDGRGKASRFLGTYGIPTDIIEELVPQLCDETVEDGVLTAPTPKRADKYDAFLEWAKDHLFEQFTTEQLVEVAGFSYQTTLKFVSESQTFRKVKKGLWEVRDEKADRKAEKNI
jgi:hypothetical protein